MLGRERIKQNIRASRKCVRKILQQVTKKPKGSDLREMLVGGCQCSITGKTEIFGDVRNVNPQFIKSENVFFPFFFYVWEEKNFFV